MKILLIIIDGLGDRPIPQFGNRTPLEAAKTPCLDKSTQKGVSGLVSPFLFSRQEYPSSDTAHLALLGYDPKVYYLGRGPYELTGIGVTLQKGDVALRANFSTVDKNLKVIDRRAGRISQTQPLINALARIKQIDGVKFIIKKSYGHRAGIVLRAKNLSAKISDGDPHRVGAKVKKILPLDKSPQAKFTAGALNKYLETAHRILKKTNSPANYLLVRGAGQMKETPSFKKKYGLKAACIAGGALYKGIGKILGMDLIKVKGANGLPNTNLKGKIQAAKRALKNYDFVFLHIKAADSLAEDGNFKAKKDFIEKIDKNLKPILNLKDTLIIVTADHSTCSLLKRHCLEPIPILIYGNGKNGVQKFSEKACQKGKFGKLKQLDLMPEILKLAKS